MWQHVLGFLTANHLALFITPLEEGLGTRLLLTMK